MIIGFSINRLLYRKFLDAEEVIENYGNRVRIIVEDKSERKIFEGLKTNYGFILGLCGAFFDDLNVLIETRKRVFKLLKSKRFDFIYKEDAKLIRAKRAAYAMQLSINDKSLTFYSMGGGIVEVDFSHHMDLFNKLRSLACSEEFWPFPLWLYIPSILPRNIHHPLDYSRLDELPAMLKRLSIRDQYPMFGEYVYEKEQIFLDHLGEILGVEYDSKDIFLKVLEIMKKTAETSPEDEYLFDTQFIKNLGKTIVDDDPITRMLYYASNVMRRVVGGELIIGAPTGGAAGIIPATLLGLYDSMKTKSGWSDILHSLYTVGCIGVHLANKITISGTISGCQAEIGAALAMAAGGLIDIMLKDNCGESLPLKERLDKILMGVSITLLSIQGLACDPLQGLEEIPCVIRNLSLCVVPYMVAKLIVSGFSLNLCVKTVIETIKSTAKLLPKQLRGSDRGPLTSCWKKFQGCFS